MHIDTLIFTFCFPKVNESLRYATFSRHWGLAAMKLAGNNANENRMLTKIRDIGTAAQTDQHKLQKVSVFFFSFWKVEGKKQGQLQYYKQKRKQFFFNVNDETVKLIE